jgi:hypothetical protein
MSLTELPAEVIENIAEYLSISDIRNLKLTSYDIYEKIKDYSLDLGLLIRNCLDILINRSVYKLRDGDIVFVGNFMLKYVKYYEMFNVYVLGSDPNKKAKGNKLMGLGYSFCGYDNMLEENEIYIKQITEKNMVEEIYKNIKEIHYKLDIYYVGIIGDVIRLLDDSNLNCKQLKNFEKLTYREKKLLMNYMKFNVIKY